MSRRSTARAATVAGLTAALVVGLPAVALASPCDVLPEPAKSICLAAIGGSGLPDLPGLPSLDPTDLIGKALDGMASSVAAAAATMIEKLGGAISTTTKVDPTAPWFLERYAAMFGLSAFLTLGLVLFEITRGALGGRPAAAAKAATGYYLLAVAAGALAPAGIAVAVGLADGLTAAVARSFNTDIAQFFEGTATAFTSVSPMSGGGIMLALFGGVALLCSLVLWVEAVLRNAAIFVSVLFAAPVFSALVNRNAWHHPRRWLSLTLAVVFAKPLVVAVLGLGAALAANGGTADRFSTLTTSVAVLILSVFAFAVLLRFIPAAGDAMAQAATARHDIARSSPGALPGPSSVVRQSIVSHAVSRPSARPAVAAGAATGGAAAGLGVVHRVAQAPTPVAAGAARGGGGTPPPRPPKSS